MPTWVWILIAVAVLVVLALLLFGRRKARERRMERHRVEEEARAESRRAEERARAEGLRGEAKQRLSEAGQQEAVAQQAAERARRERAAAEAAIRAAEDVDPEVPNVRETRIDTDPGLPRTSRAADTEPEVLESDVGVRADDSATVRRNADNDDERGEERSGSRRAPLD